MSLETVKEYTLNTKPICKFPQHDYNDGNDLYEQMTVGQARARGFFREEILDCLNTNNDSNIFKAKKMLNESIKGVNKNLTALYSHTNPPQRCSPVHVLEGMLSEYKKLFNILME